MSSEIPVATDGRPDLRTTGMAARGFFAKERVLLQLLREDWEVNFRDWTLPGFRAVAVHRFGTWVDQLSRTPIRPVLRRVHRFMFRYVRNNYGIELPVTASIGRRVLIGHQSGIVIHPHAVIGDECIIRHNVTIGGTTWERGHETPTLGRGVSVGCGAVIVGDITIGDLATIGPNAVVLTDVPPGSSVFATTPRTFKLVRALTTPVKSPTRLSGTEG
ncbi:MAG: serine acetyltransferase [Acidobacteriota bacterium]